MSSFFLAFCFSFRHAKNSSATVSLIFDPKIKVGSICILHFGRIRLLKFRFSGCCHFKANYLVKNFNKQRCFGFRERGISGLT